MRESPEPTTTTTSWFWAHQLPSPDELTPLSQTLITPDLALAFDIPTPNSTPPNSSDVGCPGGGDDQARTLKRPRLVWTPQLHKRFVDAVAHLGIKNAVPKTIMQLMSVDGLTRENVASHLQKYRLYLKRMQGHTSGAPVSAADSAMEHLFASAPVPHHFLSRGPTEQFTPFVAPVTAYQHHQMAAAAHQQQQYFHQRHIGQLASPPGAGFELGFHPRQQQPGMHRMVGSGGMRIPPPPLPSGSYTDEMEGSAGTRDSGRRVLTLFPTNDD